MFAQVFPGRMTSPSIYYRRSWKEFPTPPKPLNLTHPLLLLLICLSKYSLIRKVRMVTVICFMLILNLLLASGLPDPNSTSHITTVQSQAPQLLVATIWITWSSSLLSPHFVCKQALWSHSHTTRYTPRLLLLTKWWKL